MRLQLILFFMVLSSFATLASQTVMPLYSASIPNSKPSKNEEFSEINADSVLIIHAVSQPTLTIYKHDGNKNTGVGIIICPGGGYAVEAAGHEGADVAKRFTQMGVTAFVLKYRLPDDKTMLQKEIGPLQDAQRAIQMVREESKRFGVDPAKIGIMGFSAGGHLAATAGTHFKQVTIPNPKGTSLRPDFMVLVYPVISFSDSIGHAGSRDQLLGKNPSAEKVQLYSNELQVTAQTPPAFLVHAKDDFVKVQNSLVFADALQKAGVPVETYLYEKGGHGYGMYNRSSPVRWMDLVENWLHKQAFIN